MSKASQVFLALGTNLGRRQENLQLAVDALGKVMAVDAISPIYETAPWGVEDQPYFLNACLSGHTSLVPRALLEMCKSIERQLGRQPGIRWGPRLIDIDLIFYDQEVLDEPDLRIPHPGMVERAFVLLPLADIAPEVIHPGAQRTVVELLAEVDSSSAIRLPQTSFRLRKPVHFAWGVKTYVMGIVNVTLDSFSGDGLLPEGDWVEKAIEQAIRFEEAGADILDIGGESTRPGSEPIRAQEEMDRVIPVIEALKGSVAIPLSIDTYRAAIAEAALASGANWVNDVWGLRMDPDLVDVVREHRCPVVIMHNRSKPKNVDQQEQLGGRYVGIEYHDLLVDIRRELQQQVEYAINHGVSDEQIILDPGIGFGKTVDQNLRLLNELNVVKEMGYPLLVGPSRKSFIGYTLNLPPEDRIEGTSAAVAIAVDRGADIVRVHDVKSMTRVVRMTDAIVRS